MSVQFGQEQLNPLPSTPPSLDLLPHIILPLQLCIRLRSTGPESRPASFFLLVPKIAYPSFFLFPYFWVIICIFDLIPHSIARASLSVYHPICLHLSFPPPHHFASHVENLDNPRHYCSLLRALALRLCIQPPTLDDLSAAQLLTQTPCQQLPTPQKK